MPLMKLDLASLESPEFVLDPGRKLPYQADYETFADRQFEGERIVVDNRQFQNCVFRRCVLVYSGGMFGFDGCRFDASTHLALTGSAVRAVALHSAIAMHPDTGEWVNRALFTYGIDDEDE